MDKFLVTSLVVLVILGVVLFAVPEGAASLLVILVTGSIVVGVFRHYTDEKNFVTTVFLAGLFARLAFGIFVHTYDLREFFGGDALTYDFRGALLLDQWLGRSRLLDPDIQVALRATGSGWGMNYLVATIYLFVGRNILAAQSFCAVVGAATAPMVYYCARKIFQNNRIAKNSAWLVALFPAFIIWSGQLLKDGLIIFLLVLAITMVMQLQEKFNTAALVLLFMALGGILTLRFYIFYMIAVAVAGSFIVGLSKSRQSLVARTAILVVMGLGMTYVGITRNATANFETFGTAEQLQRSRLDLARSAKSGFSEDIDVTTTGGAISAIPIGLSYLMLAPFPWEVSSFRAAITLPEVLVWWAMIPLMIWGIWWAVKNRLRNALPVLIFSLMLTLGYSIFLGNVGTAYRQRTQIQVFLFIFIAVGWQLFRERQEDKKILRRQRDMRFRQAIQPGLR
jgi:hypothetical protein